MKKILGCLISCTLGACAYAWSITQHQLIIVGSGPAALTAAIYAGRAKLNPLVIEGNPGGILMSVSKIENWPGCDSISGMELMQHMMDHAKKVGATFISDQVTEINLSKKPFSLKTSQNLDFSAQTLIVATGMTPKKLGCPGESEYRTKGVCNCAMCDAPLFAKQTVVVAGGGIMALQNAKFLNKYAKEIVIVNDQKELSGPFELKQEVKRMAKVKILNNHRVTQICGNEDSVTSIQIRDQNDTIKTIAATGIFVSIGYEPNTELFKPWLTINQENKIEIDALGHTNVSGVFAAGTAATIPHGQAIVCASSGCIAAIEAEKLTRQKAKDCGCQKE
jgi:thioredoxin reductase (NADPH)